MRHMPIVLSFAALASVGCATHSGANRELPDFPTAGLAAPAAPSTAWSEIELPAGSTPADPAHWAALGSAGASHVSLLLGERWLDEDDWEPFDSPTVYGLEVDGTDQSSGHGYEVGVLYTNDDDDDSSLGFTAEGEVTTWELYGGYRHTFRAAEEGVHPFVSLGVGVENGDFELEALGFDDSDDDIVFGAYGRLGLLWDLTDRIRLGLDYRHFFASDLEVDIFGAEVSADADYDQVALSLGLGF